VPPKTPFDSIDWPALSSIKPTIVISMGGFDVLNKNTPLRKTMNKVGSGVIKHQGDVAKSGAEGWPTNQRGGPWRSE
jgi:hypothetical protein